MTKCSAQNLSVTALSNNQLSGYGYDAAGNMTHDSSTNVNYTLDAENRITGAAGYTYTYDADGNRVEKSNGSTGTIYWYMKPGIVAESDLGGNLKSEYVFFDGGRAAGKDFSGGTTSVAYYFSDHLETASVITNSAGVVTEDEDYYPWGGELQFVNSDSNHYKFTGKERDGETGLDYFGARYYGNWTGRFLTPDWAAKATAVPYAELADPQSLNLYSYVRNRPTATGDPDGHLGGGEEGGGPQTPQFLQVVEEPDLSTGVSARRFQQPGMAIYQSGSAPVVYEDSFESSGFGQSQTQGSNAGVPVVLPGGSNVPDSYSPTGKLMSPVADLSPVAAAGTKTLETWAHLWQDGHPVAALEYLAKALGKNLRQGGTFDYQRSANAKGGFTQLPQFRDVANFNVGLFCEKSGLTLKATLTIAGTYARLRSKNAKPSKAYGLDPQTLEFIRRGWNAGVSSY